MDTIYFIEIASYIKNSCIAIMIIGFISFLITYICSFHCYEFNAILKKHALRLCLPLLIFGTIGTIFIPNTKSCYRIFGLGGTIEYIKQNDTAKQLPDKTIKCIDKIMSDYLSEENE